MVALNRDWGAVHTQGAQVGEESHTNVWPFAAQLVVVSEPPLKKWPVAQTPTHVTVG